MADRVILYSDLNNFFASVETALHPEYKGKPLIVCGDEKKRLGVVFAKNEEAKKYGIRTAETVYSALKKCPHVLRVPTHFSQYNRYSNAVRDIYARYTDVIEPLSIDECAMDVTASLRLFGGGEKIAEEIRYAVKEELGVTVSVGVSFNKIYAKLASEMKKPDAVTAITRENYKQKVYPQPVSALLYVGENTAKTLIARGIRTIGDLADADPALMQRLFGKRGAILVKNARGEDDEPVKSQANEIRSIGNSMTLPQDIGDMQQIKGVFYALAESVASRLRAADVGKCSTVHITVKDERFNEATRQKKITPTALCEDIARAACELYAQEFPAGHKAHMLGVTVSGFDFHQEQLSFLDEETKKNYEKRLRAEEAVAEIRKKYGYEKMRRGVVMQDNSLSGADIEHRKD
ncbi:MAG: DNA polymerase IV [Candidatus Borkfalkiaceae bacterium]|nr:DNA polymerase IV [Clostridia bacterium]MDY6222941.1 DNA polymerase IV [Christensenellaceae bacterium]